MGYGSDASSGPATWRARASRRKRPTAGQRLEVLVPYSIGGLPLLGAAAQGESESHFGPKFMAAALASKRAAAVISLCMELRAMAHVRSHEMAHQVVWTSRGAGAGLRLS